MSIFPKFSKITAEDKKKIEEITSKFEPYSDFNFMSMYGWDTNESAYFSILNENLIIKIPDYITSEPTYSVIGKVDIDTTLMELLRLTDTLRFVPEVVVKNISNSDQFSIVEDRMHFDYVYSLQELSDVSGKNYGKIRNKISQFAATYPNHTSAVLDTIAKEQADDFLQLFSRWAMESTQTKEEVRNEEMAIRRFLDSGLLYDLVVVVVYVEGELAGFSINEILPGGENALCHFQKSLRSFRNIDAALSHITSKTLRDMGCIYTNWEQDLDIAGLVQMKKSYHPVKYMKKYQITKM